MRCPPPRRTVLLAALLCASSGLGAYTVEPNLLLLQSGAGSSAFVRLANPSASPTAVELVVNEFSRDLDGHGILGKPADERFIVYPAQMVLLPGDEANVQVRWVGDAADGREHTYALTTRQVLIPSRAPAAETERAQISVNVLMNYDIRVYVTPRGARPQVTVESVQTQPRTDASPATLEVLLGNHGTAHQSLRELSLVLVPLAPDGTARHQAAVTLTSREVPGMSAALLSGGQRRLQIPWPANLPAGPVRVLLTE